MQQYTQSGNEGFCVGTYWLSLGISQLKHFGWSRQLFEKCQMVLAEFRHTYAHTETHIPFIFFIFFFLKSLIHVPQITLKCAQILTHTRKIQSVWSHMQYLQACCSVHMSKLANPVSQPVPVADEAAYVCAYRRHQADMTSLNQAG